MTVNESASEGVALGFLLIFVKVIASISFKGIDCYGKVEPDIILYYHLPTRRYYYKV